MSWRLNDTSTVIGQPETLKATLKKHQLAMLYRCFCIEKKQGVSGFMADKSGTGKTIVMISLMLSDKLLYGKTQNLIIVPPNIITQWVSEIEKFSGGSLKVKTLTEYSDISSLIYDSDILQEYDVLITTVMYFDTVYSSLCFNGDSLDRIIYDEIDTMESTIKKFEHKKKLEEDIPSNLIGKQKDKGLVNKATWFISASLYNLIDSESGFSFMGRKVPITELSELVVKCDNEFVEKYNMVEGVPEFTNYECDTIIDDYSNFLSVEQLDSANSMSFQNISSKFTHEKARDSVSLLRIISSDYSKFIEEKNKTIRDLSKNKRQTPGIMEQIKTLSADASFYSNVLKSIHTVKCELKCDDPLGCILTKINSYETVNSKKDILKDIISGITPTDKFLFFSDFTSGFQNCFHLFEEYNIKYSELSKGNVKETDFVSSEYKNGDTSVLLVDASNHGAGMNLENTTCLVFLHRTAETFRDQVIGRAQRPGRTSRLKVITLYNKNEIV